MTNEQLAVLIKNNKNNKYISELWENVEKLMYFKANKYYYAMTDKFKAYGIDIVDLNQELYFAFLNAINNYDPHKNFKFVTILEFYIKNTINSIFNKAKNKNNPLNNSESLDNSISNSDDIGFFEIIADENNNIQKAIEENSKAEIVRNEVNKLGEKQKKIIKLYYFHNKNDCEISQKLKTSSSNIFQIRRTALAKLKKSPILNYIYYN